MAKRKHSRKKSSNATGGDVWMWIAIMGLIGLGVLWPTGPEEGRAQHPEPRPDLTDVHVLHSSNFGAHRVQRAYVVAAAIPETLDGIFCYCYCGLNLDHRSLLTCFESLHGSRCDVCMHQAAIAYRSLKQGKDLSQIRAAMDAVYTLTFLPLTWISLA